MDAKPVIGISGTQLTDQSSICPGHRRSAVSYDYVRSVAQNGGLPVIIPVLSEVDPASYIRDWLQFLDGIILSGGHDISPVLYGEEPRARLTEIWPTRDRFDQELLKAALAAGKPVFGICRGFQLINVYFGGKMLQDLSYSDCELIKHNQGHDPELATHRISIRPGNIFYKLFGEQTLVNSFHHQVVSLVGSGLEVCAVAADGVVEAVVNDSQKIIATQWHPEAMSQNNPQMAQLFQYFIEQCRNAHLL